MFHIIEHSVLKKIYNETYFSKANIVAHLPQRELTLELAGKPLWWIPKKELTLEIAENLFGGRFFR